MIEKTIKTYNQEEISYDSSEQSKNARSTKHYKLSFVFFQELSFHSDKDK